MMKNRCKQIVGVALAALFVLLALACAQPAVSPADVPSGDVPTAREVVEPPVEELPQAKLVSGAFSLKEDMGITVDGTWHPIYADAAPLLAALGEDYELVAAPSCPNAEWGDDKEFTYAHVTVYTKPDEKGRDILELIVLTDDTLQTARGIRVGDTTEAVLAAYGENGYWQDYILVYSVSGDENDDASPNIQFTIREGVVDLIQILYPMVT